MKLGNSSELLALTSPTSGVERRRKSINMQRLDDTTETEVPADKYKRCRRANEVK